MTIPDILPNGPRGAASLEITGVAKGGRAKKGTRYNVKWTCCGAEAVLAHETILKRETTARNRIATGSHIPMCPACEEAHERYAKARKEIAAWNNTNGHSKNKYK